MHKMITQIQKLHLTGNFFQGRELSPHVVNLKLTDFAKHSLCMYSGNRPRQVQIWPYQSEGPISV